ncbi:MAG: sugar ABC transporter ATP-binding protein [Spirochaetales bacterium]|nr:sugar ABC transporter ATP-binding protein [Spirochaetales bacterium]
MSDYYLEAKNISKSYVGVQALSNVSLSIRSGEVHCLVGENGSGKSTLIKVIGGVVQPDSGRILIRGREYQRLQAIDAIREGIEIIYQDLSLYPNLNVAENIAFNQTIESNSRIVNWKNIRLIAQQALEELGESLDLSERVENLSMSQKQIVAICRAHTQDCRLLIMDEPTSALTREEVDHLFSIIEKLRRTEVAILFVSHKLSEVFEIAENVTILRDGLKVGQFKAAELDNDKLVYHMTGQRIRYTPYEYEPKGSQPPALEVRNFSKAGQFEDISFRLAAGEILGITGLVGSGRTELALAIFGLNRPDSGTMLIDGREVQIRSPQEATRYGIGYLPEDRLSQGLFESQSIGNNIIVTIVTRLLNRLRIIDKAAKSNAISKWINDLSIKTPTSDASASSLSGGNQQRVVLAKWLATDPKIFILDGPTIGIDIGSKRNIHQIIRDLASGGMAIIIISDEFPEVLQNCNRILLMMSGRIVKEYERVSEVDEKELAGVLSRSQVQEAAE